MRRAIMIFMLVVYSWYLWPKSGQTPQGKLTFGSLQEEMDALRQAMQQSGEPQT